MAAKPWVFGEMDPCTMAKACLNGGSVIVASIAYGAIRFHVYRIRYTSDHLIQPVRQSTAKLLHATTPTHLSVWIKTGTKVGAGCGFMRVN